MPPSLQQAALALLTRPSLADKLVDLDVDALADRPDDVDASRAVPWPGRQDRLAIQGGVDRLPKLRDLTSSEARAQCLHRFANHELQATEMMAWAVLAFPGAPESFRRGLMRNAADEQRHMRLYLDRLPGYGMAFGDEPLTGNFWAQAASLKTPLAFLCAMGLTFETANLDFSILYRDAFLLAHAAPEAAVMDRIFHDEVGHVAWALSWVRRLKDPALTDLETYRLHTPFPLGLHRAKGRNFLVSARRQAGLDDAMIEATRHARPPGHPPHVEA